MLRVLTGPLSIFFITTKLTPLEQSVYYTFLSIAAIQWVFELGVSTSVVQKMASLKSKNNINALIQLGFLFFSILALILFFILLIYAKWVLEASDLNWLNAWILYSSFICLNIVNNFLLIIEEGKINPDKVYFTKLISSFSYSLTLILSLKFGYGLLSLGFSQIAIFIVVIIMMNHNYKMVIQSINSIKFIRSYIIFRNIIKFQFKLSIVWITGYLFWNFYTIFFFKYVDEVFSGQFSATNAIFNALSIGMASWLSTKRSVIGYLNSINEYRKTIHIFYKSWILAVLGYMACCFVFILCYKLIPESYLERLLGFNFIIQIIILRLLIMIQELMLIFLRTFNDEPLYKVTISNYILTPLVVIFSYQISMGDKVFIFSIITQLIFTMIYYYMSIKYINKKMSYLQ